MAEFQKGDLVTHRAGGLAIVYAPWKDANPQAPGESQLVEVNWILLPPSRVWWTFRDDHPEFDIRTSGFTKIGHIDGI